MIHWNGNVAGFARRHVRIGLGLPAPRYSVQTAPVVAIPGLIDLEDLMADLHRTATIESDLDVEAVMQDIFSGLKM